MILDDFVDVPAAHTLNTKTDPVYNLAFAMARDDNKTMRFLAEEDRRLTFTDTGTYISYYMKAEKLLNMLQHAGFDVSFKGE